MAVREESNPVGGKYLFGRFVLDTNSMELADADQKVTIERKLLQALLLLLEHADEVVTHNEFMESVWPGRFVTEQSLTTLISKLRKIIGSDAILTVHGYGL